MAKDVPHFCKREQKQTSHTVTKTVDGKTEYRCQTCGNVEKR